MSNLETEQSLSMPNEERQGNINKFGRFIKDLPFMEPYSIQSDSLDDPMVANRLVKKLSTDDSLVMLDEHRFFVDCINNEQPVGFDRISARSGQNSRHGVFFGTLYGDNYAQDVAVKVFDDEQGGAQSAISEITKTNTVKRLGVKTFTPVGVGSYAGLSFSFWELEKQVTTFDSIDWSYFIDDIPGNPGMASLIQKTADTAAFIHALGLAHGDFHPRNLAVDVAGKVFPIDWETGVLNAVEDDDTAVRYQRAYLDLSSFMTGCFYDSEHFNSGIGIFRDVPNDEAIELFHGLFLNRYVEVRKQHADNEQQIGDIVELVRSLDELPDMIR